jgi:hypothetical protein
LPLNTWKLGYFVKQNGACFAHIYVCASSDIPALENDTARVSVETQDTGEIPDIL